MQFSLRDFFAGVLLTCLIGSVGFLHLSKKIAAFEAAAAVAEDRAVKAESLAVHFIVQKTAFRVAFDSVSASNRALRGRIGALNTRVRALEASLPALDSAIQDVPACWTLCAPALAARDSMIGLTSAARDSALVGWSRADSLLTRSTQLLDTAATVIAAKDSVIAAYKHAVDLAPTRTTFWGHLKPDVGVGAWAGYDVRVADFGYGFGLTFDWSIW